VAGLGEERVESTKHTNEHVIKKMGPHSLQRLHEEGAYLKRCFLVPLPPRKEVSLISPAPLRVLLVPAPRGSSQCRLTPRLKLVFRNDWLKKGKGGHVMLVHKPHGPSFSGELSIGIAISTLPLFLNSTATLRCTLGHRWPGALHSAASPISRTCRDAAASSPAQETFMRPRGREQSWQAGLQGTTRTKGRNNSVEEFDCNCGGQWLICSSPLGRGKTKVIKCLFLFLIQFWKWSWLRKFHPTHRMVAVIGNLSIHGRRKEDFVNSGLGIP